MVALHLIIIIIIIIIVLLILVVSYHFPKVIPQVVGSDMPSHTGSGILLETEVDAAVYPGIVDVVGHLRELGVMEGHVRMALP